MNFDFWGFGLKFRKPLNESLEEENKTFLVLFHAPGTLNSSVKDYSKILMIDSTGSEVRTCMSEIFGIVKKKKNKNRLCVKYIYHTEIFPHK